MPSYVVPGVKGEQILGIFDQSGADSRRLGAHCLATRVSPNVVFIVINMKGYAQENNVRVAYSCGHSNEMPWYIPEVPTVGISLNYTNHLIDLPQIHTYINAYGSDRACIRVAIEKACGKSEFKGTASDTVFCGKWDTRL